MAWTVKEITGANPGAGRPRAAGAEAPAIAAHSLAPVEARTQRAAAGPRAAMRSHELIWVTSQLALMLETGTNIVDALQSLAEQTANESMAGLLNGITGCVASGDSLPDVLAGYPETFNRHYVASVRAGEAAGNLPEVFRRMEEHLQRRENMIHSVKMALAYPGVIFSLAICALGFITVYVLPKFAKLYQAQNVELPLPTRILIGFSTLIQTQWPLLLVLLSASAAFAAWLVRAEANKPWRDRLVLRIPVLGELMNDYEFSCLSRIVGMLLAAGMPLLEALDVARQAAGNLVYRNMVQQLMQSIVQGESLATVIMKVELINPSMRQMIRTGEQSGALARVMAKIADHLEEGNRKRLAKLSALLEPLVIILLGIMIGFIALALLLPIFKLSSTIGKH